MKPLRKATVMFKESVAGVIEETGTGYRLSQNIIGRDKPMISKHNIILRLVFITLIIVPSSMAEVPRETLEGCSLPHGTVLLPDDGSPLAIKEGGHIYSISDQTFRPDPFEAEDKRPQSIQQLYERIRAEQTGDIIYSSSRGGCLVALSGKIIDLGNMYLHALSDQEMREIDLVYGTKKYDERGTRAEGVMEGVQEGHCYFLQTLNGKYALLRVLARRERALEVQWVYQPDGRRLFNVPQGSIKEPPSKPITPVMSSPVCSNEMNVNANTTDVVAKGDEGGSAKEEDLTRACEEHIKTRKALIARMIAILEPAAKRDNQMLTDDEYKYVRALGDMRASEGADVLAKMIQFGYNQSKPGPSLQVTITMPCPDALISIGKPGSMACIKAVKELKLGGGRVGRNDREHAFMCYMPVIIGVEGPQMAPIILRSELAKCENDVCKANLEEAIANYCGSKE